MNVYDYNFSDITYLWTKLTGIFNAILKSRILILGNGNNWVARFLQKITNKCKHLVTLGIAAAGATGKSIGATAASQNPVKNYSTWILSQNPVKDYNTIDHRNFNSVNPTFTVITLHRHFIESVKLLEINMHMLFFIHDLTNNSCQWFHSHFLSNFTSHQNNCGSTII